MEDRSERSFKAMSWPGAGGNAGSAAIGVSAPVGAVSRKDRERAAQTALREGEAGAWFLETALPGTVLVQRRAVGEWETLATGPASRDGRTPVELPEDPQAPQTFRVIFSPRNADIASWVSPDLTR